MWGADNADKKRVLRRAVLAQRNALSPEEVRRIGDPIQAQALQMPIYSSATIIGLYMAIQREVPTSGIIVNALKDGKEVYLPKIEADNGISFNRLESLEALKPGRFEIAEPMGSRRLVSDPNKAAVIFVPGVAFDLCGHRLGRGQGWYDRLLQDLSPAAMVVGLAYEFQLVDEVPVDVWDRSVDRIVTEARVIDCGPAELRPVSISETHR